MYFQIVGKCVILILLVSVFYASVCKVWPSIKSLFNFESQALFSGWSWMVSIEKSLPVNQSVMPRKKLLERK